MFNTIWGFFLIFGSYYYDTNKGNLKKNAEKKTNEQCMFIFMELHLVKPD